MAIQTRSDREAPKDLLSDTYSNASIFEGLHEYALNGHAASK